MATTVNEAFNEFLKDKVNLNADNTSKVRKSRDNLIKNIHKFREEDEFFNFYTEKDILFGSFARKTKIRPLDDIDIMICISAEESTYFEYSDRIELTVEKNVKSQLKCCNTGSRKLNSTKVINKFLSKISKLHDYSKAEMHKCGEALTLQLKSYTWNFDIVPCFHTKEDENGRSYYLIPDGKGNWKKTDPRKDRERVSKVNKKVYGQMLDTIRISKY